LLGGKNQSPVHVFFFFHTSQQKKQNKKRELFLSFFSLLYNSGLICSRGGKSCA